MMNPTETKPSLKSTEEQHPHAALFNFLATHRSDRGIRAALRCGLTDSRMQRAWPYLAPFGGTDTGARGKVVRVIAGLWASDSRTEGKASKEPLGDFGCACRKLVNGEPEPGTPISSRIERLLAAERDVLAERIREMAMRLIREGHPIPYHSLARDLKFWGKKVKARWARSFWTPGPEQKDENKGGQE
jgi:CRISPR type I-E-associated protein CasB/Cse2